VVGTHFWNPPHLVPLVEVIQNDATSDDTVQKTMDLLRKAGRDQRNGLTLEGVLGPMEQSDLVGLDLTLDIQNVLVADLDRSAEPTQFLKDKVASGKVGMRTGEGFRRWTAESAEAVRERLRRYLAEQAKAAKR
jgi:3-hydroxybutyryl-CoA dehydrogenase